MVGEVAKLRCQHVAWKIRIKNPAVQKKDLAPAKADPARLSDLKEGKMTRVITYGTSCIADG